MTHAVLLLALALRAEEPSPAPVLYALNTLHAAGAHAAAHARFFDAAHLRRALPPEFDPVRVPALPPRGSRAAPPGPRREPFVQPVPEVPPPDLDRAFRRLLARPESRRYDGLISAYASRHGLDPALVKAVAAAESEFTARAKSPAGALGLLQVMPATAEEMGVPGRLLFDPEANIRAATAYLAHLFARAWRRYGLRGVPYAKAPSWVVQRVIAAYNAGPRFLAHRRLYRQTRDYIRKVLLYYRSPLARVDREMA